jgi:tetratricopeptide (TPR) repeat protein
VRHVERLGRDRALSVAWLPYVTVAAAIVLWGVAWTVNASALSANRSLIQALAPQGDPMKNLALFKQAIGYRSLGTQEAREQLSQVAAQIASASSISADVKQAFFTAATSEMKAQAAFSPLDARFPLFLGADYDAFGDYGDAAVALQKAHELSPRKQTIYFEMAQNALSRGETSQAAALYKEAYDLAPSYTDAALYYASALIRTGKTQEASTILAPLVESGAAADARILAALVDTKRLSLAIPLWQARIKANPRDMQSYATLAAIYYENGNKAQAIATLQAAEAVDPSVAAQFDPLIKEVQNGTASTR